MVNDHISEGGIEFKFIINENSLLSLHKAEKLLFSWNIEAGYSVRAAHTGYGHGILPACYLPGLLSAQICPLYPYYIKLILFQKGIY